MLKAGREGLEVGERPLPCSVAIVQEVLEAGLYRSKNTLSHSTTGVLYTSGLLNAMLRVDHSRPC